MTAGEQAKYRPYPNYERSDAPWIGKFPSNWQLTRVKFVTYVKARVGWHGLKSDDFTDEGPYLVTGSDFVGPAIKWQNCYHCDVARYDQDPYIQLQNGDLLITKDGTIGKVALVKDLDGKATLNSGVFVVRPLGNRYESAFYFWLLQSTVFTGFVDFNKTGSTIVHLYQDTFVNFKYALPSLPEQNQIAAFLDHETAKIDALIAKQQRLIALLDEKRQAVISHAVTKGLNPDAPLHPSGIDWLGDVPAHWICIQLGKLCTKVSDGPHFSPTYIDEGVPFLSARNVKVDRWSLDDVKFISEKDCNEFDQRVIPEVGDVLYTKGGTTGVARVVDLTERFQVWVHIAVLKIKPQLIDPYFLAFALNSTGCYEQSQMLTRGATNNDLGLTRMIKIWLVLPSLNEQKVIIEFLKKETSRFDKIINEAKRTVNLLKERRTALISAAVTGKIDVRDLQPPKTVSNQNMDTAEEEVA